MLRNLNYANEAHDLTCILLLRFIMVFILANANQLRITFFHSHVFFFFWEFWEKVFRGKQTGRLP